MYSILLILFFIHIHQSLILYQHSLHTKTHMKRTLIYTGKKMMNKNKNIILANHTGDPLTIEIVYRPPFLYAPPTICITSNANEDFELYIRVILFNESKSEMEIELEKIKNPKRIVEGGIDKRYNQTDTDFELLQKLKKFNYQLQLLKQLQDEKISQYAKVDSIEEYKKNEDPSKYVPNLLNGGLFSEWNFTL